MMVFIENKYTKIYFSIVDRAKVRVNNEYTEKHHIIPECFYINRSRKGPSGWLIGNPEDPSNIVTLTAREHFICHMLLVKMTSGIAKAKMVLAAIGMKRSRSYQQRYYNSRLYESVRKELSDTMRTLNLGRKHSETTRAKVSAAGKGRTHSEATKQKISDANKGRILSDTTKGKMRGFRHTDETKEIISKKNKGRKISEKTKQKMSEARKGKPKSEQHKKNIANALSGIKKKPMSTETKTKISDKLKGKQSPNKGNSYKLSDEQRKKISESNRRRTLSQETKSKISASLRKRNQHKIIVTA